MLEIQTLHEVNLRRHTMFYKIVASKKGDIVKTKKESGITKWLKGFACAKLANLEGKKKINHFFKIAQGNNIPEYIDTVLSSLETSLITEFIRTCIEQEIPLGTDQIKLAIENVCITHLESLNTVLMTCENYSSDHKTIYLNNADQKRIINHIAKLGTLSYEQELLAINNTDSEHIPELVPLLTEPFNEDLTNHLIKKTAPRAMNHLLKQLKYLYQQQIGLVIRRLGMSRYMAENIPEINRFIDIWQKTLVASVTDIESHTKQIDHLKNHAIEKFNKLFAQRERPVFEDQKRRLDKIHLFFDAMYNKAGESLDKTLKRNAHSSFLFFHERILKAVRPEDIYNAFTKFTDGYNEIITSKYAKIALPHAAHNDVLKIFRSIQNPDFEDCQTALSKASKIDILQVFRAIQEQVQTQLETPLNSEAPEKNLILMLDNYINFIGQGTEYVVSLVESSYNNFDKMSDAVQAKIIITNKTIGELISSDRSPAEKKTALYIEFIRYFENLALSKCAEKQIPALYMRLASPNEFQNKTSIFRVYKKTMWVLLNKMDKPSVQELKWACQGTDPRLKGKIENIFMKMKHLTNAEKRSLKSALIGQQSIDNGLNDEVQNYTTLDGPYNPGAHG